MYGLALTLLFFVFQAPDVALSEIVVGSVGHAGDHPAGAAQDRRARGRRASERGGRRVSRRARLLLFACAGPGLLAVLLIGLHGPAGVRRLPRRLRPCSSDQRRAGQRHATDIVTALNFDFRAFDTLGEEFILFASVSGVALLLRQLRDEDERRSAAAGLDEHQLRRRQRGAARARRWS